MSGYEQSPDYGGRDPKPHDWIVIAILFAATTALVFACNANAEPKSKLITGTASVIDGDTIEIHGQRIRLWGIDAPESAQQCFGPDGAKEPAGRRAAFALSDLIGTRSVQCEAKGVDRYKRVIGRCTIKHADVSKKMVEEGWAYAFARYSTDYVEDEAAAKYSKRGIWAWTCQAPWDWRAARRG